MRDVRVGELVRTLLLYFSQILGQLENFIRVFSSAVFKVIIFRVWEFIYFYFTCDVQQVSRQVVREGVVRIIGVVFKSKGEKDSLLMFRKGDIYQVVCSLLGWLVYYLFLLCTCQLLRIFDEYIYLFILNIYCRLGSVVGIGDREECGRVSVLRSF